MPIIEIEIKSKIARSPEAEIVCGNSDYEIYFSFDEEWSEYNVKTARFRYNGTKEDVVFEGNVCNAPIIKGASFCTVGVFAGNLHTTTPAVIVCKRGALCDDGMPADPTPDVYAQIMELLNNITGMDDEVVARALADYLEKNPLKENDPTVPAWAKQPEKPKYTAQEVGALSADSLPTAVNEALAQAKASGEFDGADGEPGQPGADGRTPVKGEDYLTEEDKQEIAEQAAELVDAAPKLLVVDIVNGWASHSPARIYAHVQAGGEAITYGMIGAVHYLDTIRETSAVFVCNNINTTAVSKDYVVIAENGKVTIGQNHYNPTVPTTLPNPNALTFTGAVEGSYDGSKPVSIEIPQGGGGAEWCEEVLEEGTLVKDVSVLYATGITLAKLREYKSFAYYLKGASNTNITNLYLRLGNEQKIISSRPIDRADAGGRMVIFEWADKNKTIIRPVSAFYGNPSMVETSTPLAIPTTDNLSRMLTPMGQTAVLRYCDISNANDTDILFFSGPVPTVDYQFSIRGLTK